MGKKLLYFLVAIIFLLLATLGYFVIKNQLLLNQLTRQTVQQTISAKLESPKPTNTPAVPPSPTPTPTPTLYGVQNAIKGSVNSKNYQALEPFMSGPQVEYTIMSSECCQPKTPQEAISALSYLDDGLPYDFNQDSLIAKTLKTKNANLKDAYVGVSTTKEKVAAFKIDGTNHINWIQVAVTWKVYDY